MYKTVANLLFQASVYKLLTAKLIRMHFFTEHDKIGAEFKIYGPLAGNSTTHYNVTSHFLLTGPAKAFAVQSGRILVIQSKVDAQLVNVILQPEESMDIPFSKVQYYIYRGIKKSSFITGADIKPVSDSDRSDFIRDLWFKASVFKSIFNVTTDPSPVTFGYWDDPLPDSLDVDLLFNALDEPVPAPASKPEYNNVKKGNWIGDFDMSCGFEIITAKDTQKIDLGYVGKDGHEIDVSAMPSTTAADRFTIKCEREKILNYIDPAAFWGLHYNNGLLAWNAAGNKHELLKGAALYTSIISKYANANMLYLDVRGERGRSYNFYNASLQLRFGIQTAATPAPIVYSTNDWPIISTTFPAAVAEFKQLQFSFQYSVDVNVAERDIAVAAYCFFQGASRKFFPSSVLIPKTTPVPPATPAPVFSGQTNFIRNIPVKSLALPTNFLAVANYYKVQVIHNQPQPITHYFNDLWKTERQPSFVLTHTDEINYAYWRVSSSPRLVDLTGKNLEEIVVTNRVFLDNGKNAANARKSRRLYQAVVSDVTFANRMLPVRTLTDGYQNFLRKSNYYRSAYGIDGYQVYKGSITDGAATLPSLVSVHTNDFELCNSYFQLGITEEEYNRLFYDNSVIPDPLPAVTHIPAEAQNCFFHLEEDTSIANTKIFRKYKLGVRYEDATGVLQTKLPLSDVEVYSVDGLFFYSKEYADYQEFYEEFAKAKVFFRPLATYNGEFGFDWLREGDVGEPSYSSTIQGGYERYSNTDTNVVFESRAEAYKSLQQEYSNLPTQVANELYHTQYLNMYSKPSSDEIARSLDPSFPKPPHEVELRIIVQIDEAVDALHFDYDHTLFTLDKISLSDRAVTAGRVPSADLQLKISCLKDLASNKYIKVFATKAGKRKLAGQIIVCKNSPGIRREIKYALVKVKTNIRGAINTGNFTAAETRNFINAMYQSIISCKITELAAELDLTANNNYRIVGGVYGSFIYKAPPGSQFTDGEFWSDAPGQAMFKDVRNLFVTQNPTYRDHFTVFAFDEPFYDGASGQIEDIGIKNLFLLRNRDSQVFPHESYHGMFLEHTHLDSKQTPNKKYFYPHANSVGGNFANATDNYMSYTPGLKRSTWYWQWKIVK